MAIRHFFRDGTASVAPMFALAMIPLIGSVGAAVDYSRAAAVRTSMQTALDSTALMLARDVWNISADQVEPKATAEFNAQFNRPEAKNVSVTASYSQVQGGYTMHVQASATVGTIFMRLLGIDDIPLSTSSTAAWGMTKLRVALVLDNTGSMAETDSTGTSKISALKTAAHNLMTQLEADAANPGDVYVSIIPFSKDVNVGPPDPADSTWVAPDWIDWTDWDANNGTCSRGSGFNTQTACTAAPVCSRSRYDTQSDCQDHHGTWYATPGTWGPAPHYTWNGCVTDRTQNFDTLNTAPTSGNTLFPAEQYSSCPAALMSMSYDWTALNAKIDAMTPAGNTNQAIGLVWGWQSLSQDAPLNAPALDPNFNYKQVVILLSDGMNTQDRWYGSASQIDARQQATCDNIKTAGITIYSVLVMSGDSGVLQNCASDSTKYFALNDANSIITTFNTIGTNLANLRLTN